MSWFTEISEKAENLLNTLDKNAAKALSKQKNVKSIPSNDSFHNTEPDNSLKILLEDDDIPIPKQNDVYLSLNDSAQSKITENPELSISYQNSVSPDISRTVDEQFQTEMLQNEIHSLNNEISLLLNRAKIAEQKTINLSDKLASVEHKNKLLEEQLADITRNGLPESNNDIKNIPSNDSSPSIKFPKTDKSEWHEHYETQIQELLQDKTNLEETLKSKNDEIMMLKSRLNQKSYSFSNDDLSSRLRALTITLVQKQSSLERLTSDKNSLEAKYDQLEKKYEEVVNMLHQRINMNDTDDVKAQIPLFKPEKTYGSGLRHRLRNAYSSLPPSLNIEVLFRKSSVVRAFVWIYLILMHGLVFLLLNSHMPETTNV
ncbi:golgin-84 [Planococcus citri]|uniref:golgin-84 n=1 Tax=Planococcus citri TaxID=170843 RepID=UPI0031F9731A